MDRCIDDDRNDKSSQDDKYVSYLHIFIPGEA